MGGTSKQLWACYMVPLYQCRQDRVEKFHSSLWLGPRKSLWSVGLILTGKGQKNFKSTIFFFLNQRTKPKFSKEQTEFGSFQKVKDLCFSHPPPPRVEQLAYLLGLIPVTLLSSRHRGWWTRTKPPQTSVNHHRHRGLAWQKCTLFSSKARG